VASAAAIVGVGVLRVAVIAAWLVVEATPREPIGDPYLAAREALTVTSALALLGLVVAVAGYAVAFPVVAGFVARLFPRTPPRVTTAVGDGLPADGPAEPRPHLPC